MLPNLLLLAAFGLAGVWLAQVVWLVREPSTPPPSLANTSLKQTPGDAPPADTIAAAQLLGRAPASVDSTQVRAADLGVSLVGVFAGGQPPLAMIQSGAKVLVLKPGDEVVPGVVIHANEPNRVLVLHAGALEALSFPPAPNLDTAPPPSAALVTPTANAAPQAANNAPLTPPAAAIRQQVRQVLKQPQSLLALVRITPVQQGGALNGYALSPVPGQEPFMRALGLHPGDVITSVDGLPLNNPATLPAIMPKLNSGQPMTLLVERGGLPVDVTINLDTLQ